VEWLEQYRTEEQSFSAAIAVLLDEAEARETDEVADRLAALEDEVQHLPERTADEVADRVRR